MKLFEVRTPDGRTIRQHHESLRAAQQALVAGYVVTGEVIGAAADMSAGLVDPLGPGTTPLIESLLAARGDVLLKWLKEHWIS